MTKTKLIMILLKVISGNIPHKDDKINEYANYILLYSETFDINPLLTVSVIFRESNFDEYMVGKAKEVGLMQIKPHSSATRDYNKFGRQELFDPATNIFLGVRHLAFSRLKCNSDNMNYYLSFYNGFRRKNGHCYKTGYSAKVMQTYRQLKKISDKTQVYVIDEEEIK